MKKTILFCAIFFFCRSLFSQVSIGLNVGDNLCKVKRHADYASNPNLVKPDTEEYPFTFGFTVGIPVEIQLSDKFSIYTMFSYLQKGSKAKASYDLDEVDYTANSTMKYNYFEIPLQVKYYFLKNKINAFITAGTSFGYMINGKTKYELNIYNYEEDSTSIIKDDFKFKSKDLKDAGVNRLDISLSIGLGIDYQFGPGKLFLNLNYLHGLLDMVNDEQEINKGLDEFNRGILTSVGYLIPLSK
jgi:hypothetical protein